jgi:hypothetical protein
MTDDQAKTPADKVPDEQPADLDEPEDGEETPEERLD